MPPNDGVRARHALGSRAASVDDCARLCRRGEPPGHADEPIEIFDAHLHYNWEPKPYYSVEEVLALFRKHRVTGILATSRPNTGTHALMDAKPQGLQIVPFIRPYRVRADIQTWFGDPFIFDLVQDEFKRGYYRGIGEFHISGKAADTEWVKKTVDFAVANDLYLHAHADDDRRRNPDAAQSACPHHLGPYRLRAVDRPRRGNAGQNIQSCGANCPTAAASSTAPAS